eukprot:3745433-Pyramimonas_sp.AAC.1
MPSTFSLGKSLVMQRLVLHTCAVRTCSRRGVLSCRVGGIVPSGRSGRSGQTYDPPLLVIRIGQ